MNNLLIIGAGQYGMLTKEIAESMNIFDKINFLDDNNTNSIDKINNYKKYIKEYKYTIVSIGNCNLRSKLVKELENYFSIAKIISPYAYISDSAAIKDGCIVEPGVVINANAKIGKSTIISAGTIINHNAIVGDFCHIDCGAIIKSNSNVSNYSKIDCGRII